MRLGIDAYRNSVLRAYTDQLLVSIMQCILIVGYVADVIRCPRAGAQVHSSEMHPVRPA